MQSASKSVGRYEILSELGRGAMGVVYKARDPKIDRLVAIKTISVFAHTPEEDREFRERLFTEAKAAGRLSHPGIVTVYDVAEDPSTLNPYIVMEYVAGHSLEKQVAESAERLPLGTTLTLIEQVAEALDYAHSQGIVHRDIKPANILLPENGSPKIADFGIAKFNFGHPTALGEGMGTPAFMSPEQLNGESVDGRSDLFSLGVVLYTLLTGYRPFQGNSALTISFKVVNRNPLPATAFDSAFPPELDRLISRSMAKDPAQRYQTGREMAAEVRVLRQTIAPARGAAAGAFAESYVNAVDHIIQNGSSPKPLRPGTNIRKRSNTQNRIWSNWRYLGAALLAFALFGLMIAILPHGQLTSEAPVPLPATASINPPAHANAASPEILRKLQSPVAPPVEVSVTPMHRANAGLRSSTRKTQLTASPRIITPTVPDAPSQPTGVAPRPTATLRLRVEHRFQQAEVYVWVDDKLSYDQTVDGTVKKKLVVFKGVEGHQSDSVRVAPGDHRFRVRVHATDDSYDQTATISSTLPAEGERQLLIQCEKHKPVRLSLQ